MRQTAALSILAALITGIVLLCYSPDEKVIPDTYDSTPEEIALAREAGRKAGSAVANFPEGSMEREGAILEIRSRETEIRNAGFGVAADTFAVAAEEGMRAAGVF